MTEAEQISNIKETLYVSLIYHGFIGVCHDTIPAIQPMTAIEVSVCMCNVFVKKYI